jgi:hypothetical protein
VWLGILIDIVSARLTFLRFFFSDPSSVVDFSDVLYDNDEFAAALYNGLTAEGVLVAQAGEAAYACDSGLEHGSAQEIFITHLENQGFEASTSYNEAHGGFLSPWSYLIFFKDVYGRELWHSNDANVNLQIRKRMLPTISGESPLKFFDGASQKSYKYPSRIIETVYCRMVENKKECSMGRGLDPELPNLSISSLEIGQSKIPGAGRGIFFKEAFSKGTYVAVDAGVHNIMTSTCTQRTMKYMSDHGPWRYWKLLDTYWFGYGFSNDYYGDPSYTVDTSIMTFINHGCNGTNNMGTRTTVTELDADPHQMVEDLRKSPFETYIFSPFYDRNVLLFINSLDKLQRDVKAGEELLDNYLGYLHEENWEWGVANYKKQCLMQGTGVVSDYEREGDTIESNSV